MRTRHIGIALQHFYPRPPRGGRRSFVGCRKTNYEFLSTPSARRATATETDSTVPPVDFYPRPPRGGRRC